MGNQDKYANGLSALIKAETVSSFDTIDDQKFRNFRLLLRETFPKLFGVCEYEEFFDGSILLKWTGSDKDRKPVMFMNHHDVVEATGVWSHDPFGGEISDGKVWGRGTLDTKGGLYCMLQAAEELADSGFKPARDIYFASTCNEETACYGGQTISQALEERKIDMEFSLDEGGMILYDPIGGADGTFAMIGMGEKGYTDILFTARSNGGHASTPGRNTPLVRLGKFMAEVEKARIFKVELTPTISHMFKQMAPAMKGIRKLIFSHPRLFKPVIEKAVPSVSPAACALLRTTIAFTMASGSQGRNVLPNEAWVIGNMRASHHQGTEDSIRAITELAKKYDIECKVLQNGGDSSLSDYRKPAYKLLEKAVEASFPGVKCAPYVMTGASDSRFYSNVAESNLRFVPFLITTEQMASIHGIDENVDVSTLEPAVNFYRYMMQNA